MATAIDPSVPAYSGRGRPPCAPRDPKKYLERRIDIATKRLSARALVILERALDEKKTPDLDYRYRIAAATQILDRAWGKAKQQVDTRVDITVTNYGDVLERARLRAMAAASAEALEATIVHVIEQEELNQDPLLDPASEEHDIIDQEKEAALASK